jgi:hypothetical protein
MWRRTEPLETILTDQTTAFILDGDAFSGMKGVLNVT